MRALWLWLLFFFASEPSPCKTIPVWYSGGDLSPKAIELQYRRPLHTFDGKDVVLSSHAGTITVKNCEQYLDAIKRGYAAANNFENKHETVFVETCFILGYVRQARPSKESYFKGEELPTNLLDLLPPIIQTGVLGTELDEDKNWRSQDPSLALVKLSSRWADLEDEDSYYSLHVDIAGDLNGDGVEDLAVFACMKAKHGTFLFCKTVAMTRCGRNEPIVLISGNVAPYAISHSKACASVKK